MSKNRVQLNSVVSSQLPQYVQEDYPLVSSFLKQYYLGQEYQSGPVDLIQNIDEYIKLDTTTNLVESVVLKGDIDFYTKTINVDPVESPNGTIGFPDSYGLLKIDNEIITYRDKTEYSFTGCRRGFVGITTYKSGTNSAELVFEESESDDHKNGALIENLSILFLKEFLLKTKNQLLPGLENRTLDEDLNQNIFLKQSKDFYLSKGTDQSFKILFNALYNKDVEVIRPSEFLFTPSNARYEIVNQLIVEPIEGNPDNLDGATLYQDAYKFDKTINRSFAPITSVERIEVGYGKTYFKLNFDGGYNRDIGVEGTEYGKFKVEPSTKIIGAVSSGSTIVDVDSTVGFGTTGELYVTYTDTTTGVVSYTSKSLTQFFGITNLTKNIADTTTVGINTFAYGRSKLNQDEIIKVRISSVYNSIDIPENTTSFKKGTTANVTTYGFDEDNIKTSKWEYNVSPCYSVEKVKLLDSSDSTYSITLESRNYLKIGNSVTVILKNKNQLDATIVGIDNEKTIRVRGQGFLDVDGVSHIQRKIQKGESTSFSGINKFSTGVDNVYKNDDDDYFIATPSLPTYNAQPIEVGARKVTFSGTFSGTEFLITPGVEHGYYTGEAVYYAANFTTEAVVINDNGDTENQRKRGTGLFADGLYFVERVDGFTLKFAKSRDDIYNGKYVSLDSAVTVTDSTIRPYESFSKTLKPQKLIRKISAPKQQGTRTATKPGSTGVLVNGVEVLNYKSKDIIKYGPIQSVDVLVPTNGIDVINVPNLIIKDAVGTGATGHIAVSGNLREVRVLDGGFDYLHTPTLKIDGGNGQGAFGTVNMKLINHAPKFFADEASAKVSLTNNTIGFSTFHKFRNAEQVQYQTFDEECVVGLDTSALYFLSVINDTTVKLHPTQADAISGTNPISLTGFGVGKHALQSVNKKSVVSSITVVNSGSGYENKKRTAPVAGINTSSNVITISNHDYKSGEIVKYNVVGTVAEGLTDNTEYYVTTVDKDSFRLSAVGISSDKEFFYRTKQYTDINSVGVGTHTFNYPAITATLVGEVGISSVGTQEFKASIQPIVRGEITSVHLENQGVGYGSSEILNLDRQPTITISSGTNAQVKPVISNGKIEQVIILNGGSNYVSTPDLRITGEGIGAVLVPIITNGVLTEVRVLEPGSGYTEDDTRVLVETVFDGELQPEFYSDLKTWRLNLFEKNFPFFKKDDGVITSGNNELQYTHLYAPRVLRETTYVVDSEGNTIYGQSDLSKVSSIEVDSDQHSPILGFAFDGNPIYGPYGYTTNTGGAVTQMRSGYILDLKSGRPPLSNFPEGFFIEDYTHKKTTDASALDENNGRFGVTPEYPNGTYAYFMTVNNLQTEESGVFEKYKKPVFPYIIGENYNSIPDEFNFDLSSNQDDFNFAENGLRRNTNPLNLIEGNREYPYVFIPNKLNQTVKINAAEPGTVDSIGILTGGTGYRVGDTLNFDNTGTGGDSAYAKVSKVKGKSISNISVASSSISGVEVYPKSSGYEVVCDNPHEFLNLDVVRITGLSTNASGIEGTYSVGISSNVLRMAGVGTTAVAIGTEGVTGLVTHFSVTGDILATKVNDVLGIGTEKVKVLNVDFENSRLRVLRAVRGTVSAAHTIGKFLIEDSRNFDITTGITSTYKFRRNEQVYFDPSETVGLGTTAGIGIGSTLSFANPGAGITQKFIPTKSLFFKNHNFKTGDQLTYSPGNGGTGLYVEDETNVGLGTTLTSGQKLFVAKIDDDLIGIATVRVGLGTTGTFIGVAASHRSSSTLFFKGVGVGNTHSFTTNHTVITGEVKKNTVTVTTSEAHGISPLHKVDVSVNPRTEQTVVVKYNDHNRNIVFNPLGFSSTGINTSTGAIFIQDHKLKSGDKVIYNVGVGSDVSSGLTNDKVYYISRVDDNNFKLSNTYYDATRDIPVTVGVASTGLTGGNINPINPPITFYKDSVVTFDLSDSSLGYSVLGSDYPAFDFNLYRDKDFKIPYNEFSVVKSGQVGSAGGKAVLTVNSSLPEILYYNVDLVYDASLPTIKSERTVDIDVISGNEITIMNSAYSGNHKIAIGGTSSFTYDLVDYPESVSYASTTSTLLYETDCDHTRGPIAKIDVINPGKNYYALPGINTLTTNGGIGAILEAQSTTIGVLKSASIQDIGFGLPSDTTLRPRLLFPQTIRIEPLATFAQVGITSFGRGFSITPKLVVVDGQTNLPIDDVDLRMTLGSSEIEILKNTNGLSNVTPTIIPTGTDSGVGISTIEYFPATKDALVTLSVGFSTANSFPFAVGDKVLVENVSVGVGSTGTNFNSAGYDYKLFELTEVTPNLGGIGSVRFNMNNLFKENQVPGQFDAVNSAGRITAQKHFPIFESFLELNDYIVGETVTSGAKTGKIEDWNPITSIVRVSSEDNFVVGDRIEGKSSNVVSVASSISSFESYLNYDASSKVIRGWQNDSGELNYNLQRVQDNFYYQRFSYSLKSEIPFDTWNDVVSATNHTLGYKKFSDYQLESTNSNLMKVGLSTELGTVDTVNDLTGFGNLNCVADFDLVTENNINSGTISDEMIFANRILSDYFESVGNRVLSIDDISGNFNSEPRSTEFSVVNTFDLGTRAHKFITYVRDKRYIAQRQLLIVDLLHNGTTAYMNQYGRMETAYDQGSFDFSISGTNGQLTFFPTKATVNDYEITTVDYNLKSALSGITTTNPNGNLGTGSTNLGGIVEVSTASTTVTTGVTTTIVSIANTYTSAKVLVSIDADINTSKHEFVELNIVHDGTNVELLEFGRLTTGGFAESSESGLGTYRPYIDGSNLKVDFIPTVGIATTGAINTMTVGLATATSTGISTISMQRVTLEAQTTSISASGSPGITTVSSFESDSDVGYYLVQVTDTTNHRVQLSEVVIAESFVDSSNPGDTFFTEFANLETHTGLGTFGSVLDSNGVNSLVFTPEPSIDTVVTVFSNTLCLVVNDENSPTEIDFTNGLIQTQPGTYRGTESDIMRTFGLTHDNDEIFERYFTGNDSNIVNLTENTITIPNHFYVSGEKIEYHHVGTTTSSVGVATTSFTGAANTTFLPTENVFAIKVDDNTIKLATSAANALLEVPVAVELESVGIGTSHRFVSTNQNAKVMVAIDNVLQSPLVATSVTTGISTNLSVFDDTVTFSGITSFFGSDLIKIGNEIMKIEGVGIGSTNVIRVRREWLGTRAGTAATGTLVTKMTGNYNIVDNALNFVEAPFGNTPIGSVTNRPDERDWTGITTGSSFQGRSFIRSGITNESNESYHKNYIFDNINDKFNGTDNLFTLKQESSNIDGITNENAIVLINDIFQVPSSTKDYTLSESSGITSITFNGSSPQTPLGPDVGISSFPKGGIIVSVGSTEGFGYQPLVSAGGTAVISGFGTVLSVSIGNSGSGYRSGIQTTVNVGVGTSSTGSGNIEFIGTAAISGGHIVSVAITNPGTGYTHTNQPFVVFDDPLSYSNMRLFYSSSSAAGVGTEATVDVVVGNGSSVIDFEIQNTGYGYREGAILTVAIGGTTGIPTTTSYSGNEFQITVDQILDDKFAGWSVGTLQVLDNIEELIDGARKDFPLKLNGAITSIVSSPGSKIDVQDVLIIFVNDILQEPGVGYEFTGGSTLTFTEALKVGDKVTIIFYKGNGDSDVIFRDVIETVKKGDTLQLKHMAGVQAQSLDEDERSVLNVLSTGNVATNPYAGPGNTNDVTLARPVTWCRQTEDKIIEGIPTGKDRELYEPIINPTSYIIKNVGIGSTAVYVDTLRPLFNPQNEAAALSFQNKIKFIPQEPKVGASATAVVSGFGTISSVVISDGGVGYSTATVSFGYTSDSRAFGTVTISAGGTVTGVAITSPGVGYTYTSVPTVLISPPGHTEEECSVNSYAGDNGIIVGFGTTVGPKFIFDIHIPYDSFLRNSVVAGTAVTITSIQANDYFKVDKSNVGMGNTFDGIYEVSSVETLTRDVVGISTTVKRIFVDASSVPSGYSSGITTSDYGFGLFSWGRIDVKARNVSTAYTAYTSGITTSTRVVRSNFLKSKNYTANS